jgi:cysteine-rich repeat protein
LTQGAEECDAGSSPIDGNANVADRCRTNCKLPVCGDGIQDSGEQCDDPAGNSDDPNRACRLDCTPRRCGDGIHDNNFGEQCDDGNNVNGDGCSSTCQLEAVCPDRVGATCQNAKGFSITFCGQDASANCAPHGGPAPGAQLQHDEGSALIGNDRCTVETHCEIACADENTSAFGVGQVQDLYPPPPITNQEKAECVSECFPFLAECSAS